MKKLVPVYTFLSGLGAGALLAQASIPLAHIGFAVVIGSFFAYFIYAVYTND